MTNDSLFKAAFLFWKGEKMARFFADGKEIANKDEVNNMIAELKNNSQTLHLLGHDWNSISSHSRNTFTARQQFFVNDSMLTNPNGYANAKATGDAIKQNYQQLSQAIGIIYAWLENLGNQQVIIDIKNRLSALEEQKKENK